MAITEYKCDICDYICGNKKSSFDKHLKLKKHLKKINGEDDTSSIASDMTETTNFKKQATTPSPTISSYPPAYPTTDYYI